MTQSTLNSVVSVAFLLLIAGGVYLYETSNPIVHDGCVLTSREPDGLFGGHFFDATCGSTVIENVAAGGGHFACARIGDVVQVTTYDNYPGTITGDASC